MSSRAANARRAGRAYSAFGAGIMYVSLSAAPAFAARPLVTDDARIVDPKACQLETWVRRNPDSTEYWALPACNPTGAVELTFGGAMTRELGATHTSDVQAQVKTLFKPLEPNGWGYGLVVGHLRRPVDPDRSFGRNLYGYVPVSFSFADDRLVVHLNAGTVVPPEERKRRGTWGVGAEVKLHETLFLIPEVFHQSAGSPSFQVGLRYWIVPNRLQVDTTYGQRFDGATHWYTLGMRVLTPPFLP